MKNTTVISGRLQVGDNVVEVETIDSEIRVTLNGARVSLETAYKFVALLRSLL
ncbi:hypothetical protein [Bifidobacterium cuniculi]|uniref:Uncharacterized protein n=1 Tax=Bifidobacterium cuniculi TaxID=1688 RepID=A0A087AT66_9BIFI|nr:hypothetical protein [Bifidobacterium cuniculi]KFI61966.1 hypothetical protein BCUN_3000 [Bifidobacterium cuniculi]